jgi:hypothetical protein
MPRRCKLPGSFSAPLQVRRIDGQQQNMWNIHVDSWGDSWRPGEEDTRARELGNGIKFSIFLIKATIGRSDQMIARSKQRSASPFSPSASPSFLVPPPKDLRVHRDMAQVSGISLLLLLTTRYMYLSSIPKIIIPRARRLLPGTDRKYACR